jgi:hypothetical protein
MLTLLFVGVMLGLTSGCTSTLKAVTGTYSYYEVIDGKVTYFRWNPMGMRYHTRVLEQADPATFEAIGTDHGKDATTVYEWDIPILHADPATFKRLTENYARDATQVYWLEHVVDGADPATFEVKEDRIQTLARDVNQCFSGLRVVTCDALNPKGQAYCRC